jgi:transposase
MRDWFNEKGVTHVAMESTGVYWKPIHALLEDGFEVVNRQRVSHQGGAGA